MGQFQKVSAEDDDDEGENEALVGGSGETGVGAVGKEYGGPSESCLGCLTLREAMLLLIATAVFLGVAASALCTAVNAIAKRYVILVSSSATGAATSVSGVRVGMMDASTTIWDLVIANPPGYPLGSQSNFLHLNEARLALNWGSLLSDTWELQEISLVGFRLDLQQGSESSMSNGQLILSRLAEAASVTPAVIAGASALRGGADDLALAGQEAAAGNAPGASSWRGLFAVPNKIIADRVSIIDMELMCIQPMCDATSTVPLGIRQIVVQDIGRKGGGVRLFELVDIVLQAAIRSAISVAPSNIGLELQREIGGSLVRPLDYKGVLCDTGAGLQELSDYSARAQLQRLRDEAELAGEGQLARAEALRGLGKSLETVESVLERTAESAERQIDRARQSEMLAEAEQAAQSAYRGAEEAAQGAYHGAEALGERMANAVDREVADGAGAPSDGGWPAAAAAG